MKFIIYILITGIGTTYLINALLNWRNKKKYINAGKKWDDIVEELRKRK